MRRSLELAWESYHAGSFQVGAVLTDPDGAVMAEGRNHAGEAQAADGVMRGTVIAHAEMSVLAKLLRERPGRVVSTTRPTVIGWRFAPVT